jgi:tripeptide aminopeptidase
MPDQYKYTAASRFLQYGQVDTQSDPDSKTQPSTAKQLNLGRTLVDELKQLGIDDAQLDEYGYVYATIPSNSIKQVPVICFCAHMDTAPDCSGTGVKPIVHENYNGGDIVLPDDPAQVISSEDHPYLKDKIGEDIITASGTTLLGADDKAGVAIIMDLANYLVSHPEVKHGGIKILFTPDEEIGRGVDKVDMQKLGADFGYTLDGGERGSLEDETFSADGVHIVINGVSAHPGYARNQLVSALKIVAEFVDSFPKDSYSPETTEGREGFFHPVRMTGTIEQASVELIIRDFHTHKLLQYENFLRDKLDEIIAGHPGATASFNVQEQYRNMKEILDQHPQVSAYAKEAIERAGMKVEMHSARGGTDGSRLSFIGLPCPNLFTGEMAYHGKHEYVSIQDMQKSVDMCVELVKVWEEKS